MRILDLLGDIIFHLLGIIWALIKIGLIFIILVSLGCSIVAFFHVITLMKHLPEDAPYCDIYNPELIELVFFCKEEE